MKKSKTFGRRREIKILINKLKKEIDIRIKSKDTSLDNLTKLSHLQTSLSIAERRLANILRGIPEYGDEQAIVPLMVKIEFIEQ